MGKILGALIGIFFALAGPMAIGYAGYWWAMDRPAWHVGWCPFCVGWKAGAGAQLADANAKLAVAIKDVASLESAVSQQNAATQALASRGATALQDAQKAVQRYASASQATATRVRIISAPIVGDDTCARVKAFDATFLESLK